ncbi:MAG: VCBS repeat-containing protein [Candidatus Eisenbacteria bacterium]
MFHRDHQLLKQLVLSGVAALLIAGCGGKKDEGAAGGSAARESAAAVHPAAPGATIYLAEAQFIRQTGTDGKTRSVPGPARLAIWTKGEGGWTEEVIEDPESNVFHKAMWYAPPTGEPGILTIGATEAHLKVWRKQGGTWEAEEIWHPTFGGKWDRLRDVEVGDVDGDGVDDIAIATHDVGVIAVVSWKDGAWRVTELDRRDETFVHEVEVGDVDGDGVAEIFTTPSKPNKLDGTPQPGEIDMFDFEDGKWSRKPVDVMADRHSKEILCVTLTGETRPVLFTALEGTHLGGDGSEQGDNTRIRLYRFDGGEITQTDIAGLPGNLCRFLTYGDTDGDGVKELIASTKSNGIWKLTPGAAGEEWKSSLIAAGTSGFEHATCLADFDGDGKDEIYVASDDQGELRCYWYDGNEYRMYVIGDLKVKPITFNIATRR